MRIFTIEYFMKVKGKDSLRILFLTQWRYDDALVQTYTLPYVQIVKDIASAYSYLVTTGDRRLNIVKKGVSILIELPDPTRYFRLQWFFNFFILNRILKQKNISTIHAWCTPAGSIGAILKVIRGGVSLILDSVEPHAESMVECKIWSRGGIKFRALSYLEKLQFKKADKLIFCASGMDMYIAEKYNLKVSGYVKPACVNLKLFSNDLIKNKDLLRQLRLEDKIVCLYAGKFGGFYMEDETFEFVKQCIEYWGKDRFRFLLLSNVSDAYLQDKLKQNGIDRDKVVKLFVSHSDVPKYMGLADFAICPNKPVPSKRYGTPIKNGEYWAMGLPVVIAPNISDDSDIVKKNKAGAILEGFATEDYIKAIKQIDSIISKKSREEVYSEIRPIAEKYRNFSIAKDVYSLIYASS